MGRRLSNRKNDGSCEPPPAKMRIGIELTSAVCRIVELDAGGPWRRAGSTRIVSTDSWSRDSTAIGALDSAARLARFRGRQASVVLWNISTDHRHVPVHPGTYDRMLGEARTRLADAELSIEGMLSDIAPASGRASGSAHNSVVLASAPRAEVSAALAPLAAAGIKVRSVLTPAAALQSLARLRSASAHAANAHVLEAYVAVEEQATCFVILRGGVLLATQDLPWGFLDELSDFQTPRERYDIAVRLADELGAIAASGRFDGDPLAQVMVCGAMPELRSMTVHLMERLDVEVEPLDSLFSIDVDRIPAPVDEFHDAIAGLRLAWAAAANPRPALDLLRHHRRETLKSHLARAAVVAGTAAGVSVGWVVQRELPAAPVHQRAAVTIPIVARPAMKITGLRSTGGGARARSGVSGYLASQSVAAPVSTLVAAAVAPPASIPVMPAAPVPAEREPASAARSLFAEREPAPVPRSLTPGREPAPVPRSLTPEREPTPATRSQPAAREPAPPVAHSLAPAPRPWESVPPISPPPASVVVAPRPRPVAQLPTPSASPAAPQVEAPSRRPVETPAPFDAALETILFSPDRSLAIVDGRIVQVGDDLHGARIVDITASAVLLRDAQGRLRRLSLSGR